MAELKNYKVKDLTVKSKLSRSSKTSPVYFSVKSKTNMFQRRNSTTFIGMFIADDSNEVVNYFKDIANADVEVNFQVIDTYKFTDDDGQDQTIPVIDIIEA